MDIDLLKYLWLPRNRGIFPGAMGLRVIGIQVKMDPLALETLPGRKKGTLERQEEPGKYVSGCSGGLGEAKKNGGNNLKQGQAGKS